MPDDLLCELLSQRMPELRAVHVGEHTRLLGDGIGDSVTPCPMLMTEIAPEQASMYSRPSLSQIRIPWPRTASGSSPRRSCWSQVGAVTGSVIVCPTR